MSATQQQIANLEWINYEATVAIVQATAGLDISLRDDVILTSSEIFPVPDTTHACLLRARPETIDNLIIEIIDYFKSKNLPPTIFISPACTPGDLPERLLAYGFVKNEEEEVWMLLQDLLNFKIPSTIPKIIVKQITENEVSTFAHIFMTAFDMPIEFAPDLVQLMAPSVNLPGVYHYLAFIDEQPVATFSLLCYKNFGIIGSAGVLPACRGRRVFSHLLLNTEKEAQQQGIDTLILQIKAGTPLERFLPMNNFKKLFTRISYTLS